MLPVNPGFEHGLLVIEGDAKVNGEPVSKDHLIFLPTGFDELILEGQFKGVLIGGEPFDEPIVMWWNFVARTSDEIVEMRETWNARSSRYGEVQDDLGSWIPAPVLPNVTLRPRI
jgi:redox-sensitive bicupin YhaK (pirin superfamily)